MSMNFVTVDTHPYNIISQEVRFSFSQIIIRPYSLNNYLSA